MTLTDAQKSALAVLTNGIIPADDRDSGAAVVDAAGKIAAKVEAGVNAAVYLSGIDVADRLSRTHFEKPVTELTPAEVHALVGMVKSEVPGFYKQLRLDVTALYLSDPGVWTRIGFPGPSTASGGYPDFDHPQ